MDSQRCLPPPDQAAAVHVTAMPMGPEAKKAPHRAAENFSTHLTPAAGELLLGTYLRSSISVFLANILQGWLRFLLAQHWMPSVGAEGNTRGALLLFQVSLDVEPPFTAPSHPFPIAITRRFGLSAERPIRRHPNCAG